jgi:hypothetical protein
MNRSWTIVAIAGALIALALFLVVRETRRENLRIEALRRAVEDCTRDGKPLLECPDYIKHRERPWWRW